MSWLSLISTALGIVSAAVSYLRERKLIDGAMAEAVNAHLKGALDDIKNAQEARDRMDKYLRDHPGRLPGDDPNRRD